MTPVNIRQRKSWFRSWLKYDGQRHDFKPVRINPDNYKCIGETKDGKVKFFTLTK